MNVLGCPSSFERQAAFGHIINQLVASDTVIRGAGTLPFGTVFSSVVSVWRLLPLARRCCRRGNGDGLRLAHACVVVGHDCM
ncbi:hypothetical protein O9993_05590 [Vibrio lentus]|nr:hypothetical protein [Vibrio lentus]